MFLHIMQAETTVFWVYALGREIPPLGNRLFLKRLLVTSAFTNSGSLYLIAEMALPSSPVYP